MSLNRFVLSFVFILCSLSAWSSVFIQWSDPELPASNSLGVRDIVLSSKSGFPAPLLATARKQGYRVYIETSLKQAADIATTCLNAGCTGIVLDIPEKEAAKTDQALAALRSTYPKLQFLVLDRDGKQPQMRGSLVIKRDSVLEVSSPTAQPWIDTNLALIKVDQRAFRSQVPLYTFSWSDQGNQKTLTSYDYSLAITEANAFHADMLLPLSPDFQKSLARQDPAAWSLWKQAQPTLKFGPDAKEAELKPAANVAVVLDQPDASDEVLNLLGRHNIPTQVFLPQDLKSADLKGFDVVIVFAKPDAETADKINTLANAGATAVLVDSHGKYPWQGTQPLKLNDQTNSYTVENGKVLELAEPVSDPETFAQDIRRLLGKSRTLLSLWNGLTTIAMTYKDPSGSLKLLELVNYAGDPVRLQIQVKGSFSSIRYESPERGCCQNLEPVTHDGFTEFVIPDLTIAGRVHLGSK